MCRVTVVRSFDPVVVPKHQSRGLSIEKLVISLYAKGMSVSDIEDELRDIYDINLSSSAISLITNKVMQSATDWQNRPLESLYMVVWMDGIVFKVRESCKVINKTVYLCIGLNTMGYKEVLGMWVGKTESSSFWMSVLTDLKVSGGIAPKTNTDTVQFTLPKLPFTQNSGQSLGRIVAYIFRALSS